MAIEIRALAKPEIYLIGNSVSGGKQITGELFSGVVDHSKSGTTSILSTTQLDKEDVLTFSESVRIIITGQITPKPSYFRRDGRFNSTEFEGKTNYSPVNINFYAETFYTLNGKDPVRNSNYLYKFLDRDDLEDKTERTAPYYTSTEIFKTNPRTSLNPSDPSGYNPDPSGEERYEITTLNPSAPGDVSDNLNSLGFILRNNKTGDSLITLKTRTFYRGRISPITVAYFKIYNSTISTTIIDNQNNND